MPSSGVQTCALDRKSTRLNSSHTLISFVAVSFDRKSTRLNSSHTLISYAVFCLKKKLDHHQRQPIADRRAAHDIGPSAGESVALHFFFNDRGPPEIPPLPPHDALRI